MEPETEVPPVEINWQARAVELKDKLVKTIKWARNMERTLKHIAKYGYESVVENREAECKAYRNQLRIRDFEWWEALCLVDNVEPTPLGVKRWLLILSEYEQAEAVKQYIRCNGVHTDSCPESHRWQEPAPDPDLVEAVRASLNQRR